MSPQPSGCEGIRYHASEQSMSPNALTLNFKGRWPHKLHNMDRNRKDATVCTYEPGSVKNVCVRKGCESTIWYSWMEPSRVALTRVSPSGVNFMMCAGRMSEPVTFTLFNDTTGNSNSASSYNVLANGFHYTSSYALNLFLKDFWRTISPFRGATDAPVLDFWRRLPWDSKTG